MLNPSDETPASYKVPKKNLKDKDVLCTFKIKIVKIMKMGAPKTNVHIQIKIKMPNPSQELPVSSKARNADLKDMDVLQTFKIKRESQKLDHWYIKYLRPYPNQD